MPDARFAERYTPEQRAAARRELALGVPVRETCRRAAAGELAPGMAAFQLAEGTARSWRDAERKRAAAAADEAARDADPGSTIAELRGELLAAIRAELRDARRKQARGENVAGEALRQLGRALREANALVPGGTAPPEHAPPGSTAPSRQAAPGIAGAILTEHRKKIDTAHTHIRETAQDEPTPGHAVDGAEHDQADSGDRDDGRAGSRLPARLAQREGGDMPMPGAQPA